MRHCRLAVPAILAAALLAAGCRSAPRGEPTATFSIVAFDPETKDLGVAVASRVLAVGSVVPWARAGVGAVATQAYADPTFGPRGLELLAEGKSPEEALATLLEGDAGREERQVALVDGSGRVARFTGSGCNAWAGSRAGEHYSAQGNILASEEVVKAMEKAYEEAKGELALRLLAALEAGDAAGGDRRGKQSAAILVVREGGGYAGKNDRYLDLRVDDHAEPVRELRRLAGLALIRPLLERAEASLAKGDREGAERTIREASSLAPESGLVRYFVARVEALAGRKDDAIAALQAALAAQPELRQYLPRDESFETLREDERFRRLLEPEGGGK